MYAIFSKENKVVENQFKKVASFLRTKNDVRRMKDEKKLHKRESNALKFFTVTNLKRKMKNSSKNLMKAKVKRIKVIGYRDV